MAPNLYVINALPAPVYRVDARPCHDDPLSYNPVQYKRPSGSRLTT